jgi:hypothetical protein
LVTSWRFFSGTALYCPLSPADRTFRLSALPGRTALSAVRGAHPVADGRPAVAVSVPAAGGIHVSSGWRTMMDEYPGPWPSITLISRMSGFTALGSTGVNRSRT